MGGCPARGSRATWPTVVLVVSGVVVLLAAAGVALLAGAAALPGAGDGSSRHDTPDPEAVAPGGGVRDDDPSGTSAVESGSAVVARAAGIELVVSAAHTLVVGFHEAGHPTALELEVAAPVAADHAGDGFEVAPGGPGPTDVPLMVLPSRRRGGGSTTAMDVVVPAGRPVLSPVDGTVVRVDDYLLYGTVPDTRIGIAPDGDGGIEVVLLHVEGPAVAVGDVVEAGRTVVASSARHLDVGSQIDRYTRRSVGDDPPPHVHVELRRR